MRQIKGLERPLRVRTDARRSNRRQAGFELSRNGEEAIKALLRTGWLVAKSALANCRNLLRPRWWTSGGKAGKGN
ncbi:hypothetical protein FHT82_005525 [Rhizobium sp. BK275]|uniref:hypothetical protein n=1 Tax=Rhizobium sp. BK275 TaxID=2587077 RepID=UPI00160931DF|nr:hypothetical protein [Rhizobium sp. BK275]MBB3392736.1 hypothetical protein [Rhizobium sp. BK275]